MKQYQICMNEETISSLQGEKILLLLEKIMIVWREVIGPRRFWLLLRPLF